MQDYFLVRCSYFLSMISAGKWRTFLGEKKNQFLYLDMNGDLTNEIQYVNKLPLKVLVVGLLGFRF